MVAAFPFTSSTLAGVTFTISGLRRREEEEKEEGKNGEKDFDR